MPGTIVVVVLLIILIIFVVMMFNKIVKSGNENIKAVKTLDQVLKKKTRINS